jgi:ribosomal protein S27AE
VCGAVVLVVAGPIAGAFAFKQAAVLGTGSVPCPKCSEQVALTEGLAGWPARVHCQKCGAMVELNPAQEVSP